MEMAQQFRWPEVSTRTAYTSGRLCSGGVQKGFKEVSRIEDKRWMQSVLIFMKEAGRWTYNKPDIQ